MFQCKTRWADCAVITSVHKSLTKRYATPAGGRLPNRSRPRWSRGLRFGRKVAAMRKRRRNPRRRVACVKETIVFHRPGETPPDPIPHVTVLECGHEVPGYTVGRYRACPECGREVAGG